VDNKKIVVKNAKVHNLKNVSITIPKNSIVVFSGVSGSGKSSLAFDTIFAEGQRRYIESLSSYARQFLGQLDKPDVESITGIMPAISIDQKTTSHNPRSTVGTITEIWDYLRLLYSKLGDNYCLHCGNKLSKATVEDIYEDLLFSYPEENIIILAPISESRKGAHDTEIMNISKLGYSKLMINSNIYNLNQLPKIDKKIKNDISVVIDRLKVEESKRTRIIDALEQALNISENIIYIKINDKLKKYSIKLACLDCHYFREQLEPRNFSFNSPFGACTECEGIGSKLEVDLSTIISNFNLSVLQGAIIPWADKRFHQMLKSVFIKYNVDINTPYNKIPKKLNKVLLYGDSSIKFELSYDFGNVNKKYFVEFEGIIKYLERKKIDTVVDDNYKNYFYNNDCNSCGGSRLKKESLSVKFDNKNIHELASNTITSLVYFFNNIKLKKDQSKIATPIIRELSSRLNFLNKVGLGYLTLTRSANSLSGGESQRIRLASQIGSGLSGVLYVLDEPSIGLHPTDNSKLISTLKELKKLDNTLIVVEHDEETIMNSDYLIDIGPKAGKEGGEIIYQGIPSGILNNDNSLTGLYLSKKIKIETPINRRVPTSYITIKEASEHNLKSIDVKIPLSVITTITGVSGSGKSTLVMDILANYLLKNLNRKASKIGKNKGILGTENIDKIVIVDQSPIGRTPRSNPATYTGLFQPIRELFSNTNDAKIKGYNPGRFSFNVKTGRCANCEGDGYITVTMNFLPDIQVTCIECNGKRYNNETLNVKYKNKNIFEVLDMTVNEATRFFSDNQSIYNYLTILKDVGLGYIKLGQSATTLSGGEAQRVKLASELHKKNTKKTLYIFDEPTTGLHFYDVDKLISIFHKLANLGNTLLIIEHNLDIIRISDHIIDLGPNGGPEGGYLIATGTPEEIANNQESITGKYVKKEIIKYNGR
jgi:excinuclease ABC subunit A